MFDKDGPKALGFIKIGGKILISKEMKRAYLKQLQISRLHNTKCLIIRPITFFIKSSKVKMCSVKSLPGEKRLDSLPPRQ